MEKWLKISHTGELSYVDLSDSRGPGFDFLHGVYDAIGCDLIEIVRVTFKGHKLCMIIDECGKLRDSWPDRINSLASLLYDPGSDCIVGDVLLGEFAWSDDGEICVPCSAGYYDLLCYWFTSCFTDIRMADDVCF